MNFDEVVARYIGPLVEPRGFEALKSTPYEVRFESPIVALTMLHDRYSYEIEVFVGRKDDPSRRYSLQDVVNGRLGTQSNVRAFFQASDTSRLAECVRAIAELLRTYGDQALAGDPAAYQRIAELSQQRAEAYTRQVVNAPIPQAAEEAWKQKNFAKVRALYESIAENLTPSELKRMEYAKSH